jgi:dTDP-4-dehydrorhamnose reductase
VKNILFFGGTGKLGKYWIRNLIQNNKVFANENSTKLLLNHKNLQKIKLNLNHQNNITDFSKKNKVSVIINCIALTNIELCESNKKKAINANYLIPSKLCKVSKRLNIPLVHISTDMLFDGKLRGKYGEKSKCKPVNIYSKTKIKAENLLLKYKKSLIIRTNFFGFGNKKNQTFSDKLILQQKLNKKSFLWNDIFFSPMYIPNLVFFINLLIRDNARGIFNISSDECTSKFNFGVKLIKSFVKNNKIYPNSFSTKNFVMRPKNMCLNNKKIKKKYKRYVSKLKLNYQIQSFLKDYRLINNGY